MYNKKAIGAVVATALMLVVAVFAIVSFQTWYNSYSAKILNNAETSTDIPALIKVNDVIGDVLYMKSAGLEENQYVQEFKIKDKISQVEVCSVNLKTSLTGHYTFDDTLQDSSSKGWSSSTGTNISYIEGKYGKALKINTGGFVNTNVPISSLISSAEGTITFWVKDPGLINGNSRVYDLPSLISDSGGYINMAYGVSDKPALNWIIGFWNSVGHLDASEEKVSSGGPYLAPFNDWVHFTWKISEGNIFLFRNGLLIESDTVNSVDNLGGKLRFGINWAGFTANGAEIDDVRIYNTGLSDEEIKNIYTYSKAFENGNLEFDLTDCNLDKNKEYSGVIVTDKQVINYEFYYN